MVHLTHERKFPQRANCTRLRAKDVVDVLQCYRLLVWLHLAAKNDAKRAMSHGVQVVHKRPDVAWRLLAQTRSEMVH